MDHIHNGIFAASHNGIRDKNVPTNHAKREAVQGKLQN
jgi:hypothetical protein